jgi:hypothetical protein
VVTDQVVIGTGFESGGFRALETLLDHLKELLYEAA